MIWIQTQPSLTTSMEVFKSFQMNVKYFKASKETALLEILECLTVSQRQAQKKTSCENGFVERWQN